MIVLAVSLFFGVVTVLTGPTGTEWRERRTTRRDRPLARVVYLPSAACHGPGPTCPNPAACAICKSRE